MIKNVFIAISLLTSTLAYAGDIKEDLDNDGIKETYRLERGLKGQTLQKVVFDNVKDISIKDGIPFNYRLIKIVKQHCVRVGVPRSDDFYDICSKNDEYYSIPSPALH